jgi:hypothetical protein
MSVVIQANAAQRLMSAGCVFICVFYITSEMQQLIKFSLLLPALYMFRAVFPPIIRSL